MAFFRFLCICLGLCARPAVASPCGQNETADEFAANFNLSGKIAIVTGGDSGLGFAASEALARRGAVVVIAGHSAAKSDAAARNLSAATGGDVRSSPVNLASLKNVRAFAEKFLNDFGGKLHFLINDAGIPHEYVKGGKTEDGFEEVFQVDYLGPFLLTELLLPALRKSSPARVVNVASVESKDTCIMAGFSPECAKDFTYIPPPVTPQPYSLYGLAKLLQIEHAAELTVREAKAKSGVTAYSLCPGLVVTDMTKEHPEIFKQCKQIPGFQTPCPYSPQQGAAVITYTTLGDAQPGLWYERRKGCTASPIFTNGFTDTMRPELYSRSLEMVGMQPEVTIAV